MKAALSYFKRYTIPVTFNRWRERAWMGLAWRLPAPLVYWAAIRLIAHATQGDWSSQVVPELKAMDALKRWEKKTK